MVTFLLAVILIALVALLSSAVSRKRIKFGKVKARIHKIKKDGTYEQMFKSISDNLDKLCFTKDQIELFLQQRPDWFIRSEWRTLFLFKEDGQFRIARVYLTLGRILRISSYSLENPHIWPFNKPFRRIVVPAL